MISKLLRETVSKNGVCRSCLFRAKKSIVRERGRGRLGGRGAHFLCVDDDGALKVMERFFVADVEQNNIWQAEKTKLRWLMESSKK